jgi:hypothetical protein
VDGNRGSAGEMKFTIGISSMPASTRSPLSTWVNARSVAGRRTGMKACNSRTASVVRKGVISTADCGK